MDKGSNRGDVCNIAHRIAKIEMERLPDSKNWHKMDKEIDGMETNRNMTENHKKKT